MTNSTTPSPELLNQWSMDFYELGEWRAIAIQAAQWGADQELEACCEWLFENDYDVAPVCLRASRRPKPPSLKERLSKAIIDGDEREVLKLLEELDDSL